mmetsp:Transcript_54326/g.90141  ORF Transcript_54326/g.90141 Transcript_54326/m.90141 type:complete len:249 (-) Transcript_54326:146-892(-)|eukprot:CAMPEP_0119314482 /NCGR_PEP_ID=MMETSP1333-20130426/32881_1 /TAXON_ID=418940 /ORGANISM="Scyphosphaera apsteinii, Strain RCC1455" /LENGTH=248 /DNA_ID=CAMNT_0007319595 /DNA_START=22 /DNA_END=768 /DNA_ORIENTATION=+
MTAGHVVPLASLLLSPVVGWGTAVYNRPLCVQISIQCSAANTVPKLRKRDLLINVLSWPGMQVLNFMGLCIEEEDENYADVQLSTLTIASFLANPELVDPALKSATLAELTSKLKADGVSEARIGNAITNVLPYLPSQQLPGTTVVCAHEAEPAADESMLSRIGNAIANVLPAPPGQQLPGTTEELALAAEPAGNKGITLQTVYKESRKKVDTELKARAELKVRKTLQVGPESLEPPPPTGFEWGGVY